MIRVLLLFAVIILITLAVLKPLIVKVYRWFRNTECDVDNEINKVDKDIKNKNYAKSKRERPMRPKRRYTK